MSVARVVVFRCPGMGVFYRIVSDYYYDHKVEKAYLPRAVPFYL